MEPGRFENPAGSLLQTVRKIWNDGCVIRCIRRQSADARLADRYPAGRRSRRILGDLLPRATVADPGRTPPAREALASGARMVVDHVGARSIVSSVHRAVVALDRKVLTRGTHEDAGSSAAFAGAMHPWPNRPTPSGRRC